MELIVGIIGTIITSASFVFGLMQWNERRKIIKINRDYSWQMYMQIYRTVQALQLIKQNPENQRLVIEQSNRGEACGQELLDNSIGRIKEYAEKFDETTIDRWIRAGKMHDPTHKPLFLRHLDS